MSKPSRLFGMLSGVVVAVIMTTIGFALAALPPGGTFIDDDGNVHEGNIEAIAAEGITKGCNPSINDRYCPSNAVTRGQMAAFIRRALNLPSSSVDLFVDDNDSEFESDINAVAEAGITKGCNPPVNDRFCPDSDVTRDQMAAFLNRAFEYPSSPTDFFTDDNTSEFEDDINAIAAAGVTMGCSPPPDGRYCPKSLVLRDQMASFLSRAVGLDPMVPPPRASYQPEAPIRAAFMYPWFPNAWKQGGVEPYTWYSPSLGLYDSSAPDLIDQQVALASGVGLEAFIASWWGPGHHTDSAIETILNRIPLSPDPDFRLAVYYEEEGRSDPSSEEIVNDLKYLQKLFDSPSYLRVDGKPVVFVWSTGDSGPDLAKRWADAKRQFGEEVFVVLKVFSGFRDVLDQPDSWHQYGPASPYQVHLPYSAVVSPGFWLRSDASPTLVRDPARFRSDAEKVAASSAFWQLVTTWNEWGEGTAVEPAAEFGTTYLDILDDAFGAYEKTPRTTPPPTGSVTFTAAGDLGANTASTATLNLIADLSPDAHFLAGDFSYNQITPESAWCSYVKDIVGTSLPFELVTGNHEDDNGPDGFVRNFTECMPDRSDAVGDYGVQFYTDLGGMVRVIAIAADLEVDGVKYRYTPGSQERQWLESAVSGARSQGKWVVIVHHKLCISAGDKDCAIGEELADWEAANADVVVMGHAHMYQRSHQLSCVDINKVTQSCVADSDGNHQQGDGAVFVVNGIGGKVRPVDRNDSEAGYFATLFGADDPNSGHGIVQFDVSATTLAGTFIGSDTAFTDSFTIQR